MEAPDLSLVATDVLVGELISRHQVAVFTALPLGENYDWRVQYTNVALHELLGLLEVAKGCILEGRIGTRLPDEEEDDDADEETETEEVD